MTTGQLYINTCDKIRSLDEYSLISENLHLLPLESLVNCAKRIELVTVHVLYLEENELLSLH